MDRTKTARTVQAGIDCSRPRWRYKDDKVTIKPTGTAYTNLRVDLIGAPQLGKYNLKIAATLAPEELGGFNIEGLAATPDGRLLLGFRNPITEGKALVVPIENPKEVVNGKRAEIGMPDRDCARWSRHPKHRIRALSATSTLVVAGAFTTTQALLRFTHGQDSRRTVPVLVNEIDFGTLNVEGSRSLHQTIKRASIVISDDGGRKIGEKDCKKIDLNMQRFRATSLTLP